MCDHDPNDETVLRQPAACPKCGALPADACGKSEGWCDDFSRRLATREELCGKSEPRMPLIDAEAALVAAPAGSLSPQEIAEMRRLFSQAANSNPHGDFVTRGVELGAYVPRLLDAIEALTAKNQRLTDALNTSVLEACEEIDDRLRPEIERLTADNARLTSERDKALAEFRCAAQERDVFVRRVEELENIGPARILRHERDALKAEVERMKEVDEVVIALSDEGRRRFFDAIMNPKPPSPRLLAAASRYKQRMGMDDDWYAAHRRRVEADHAAAKDAGIDMDLLGKLCREEPDEATKRDVASMMAGLYAAMDDVPLSRHDYPALVDMARESIKDGD